MEETIKRTKDNLFYLIGQAALSSELNIREILSRPNHIGETVFQSIFFHFSDEAINMVLQWNIDINTVTLNFDTCGLSAITEYTEILLRKKLNPKIIGDSGKSPLNSFQQLSIPISSKLRKLIKMYPNAVYFSTERQTCNQKCHKLCKSKMEPFRIGMNGDGEYIIADDKTRIGHGGFGTVFHGKWHGEESAFKYIQIKDEENKNVNYVHEAFNKFNKNIKEYREQLDVSRNPNSGIIIPNAFYRQQLQKQDDYGKWIAFNYNVFVYPRYDCNLYELHKNYFSKMDDEVKFNIIDQCFTR